jgi:hypothetical protein
MNKPIGKEVNPMIKLAVSYVRYALVALATVGFGIAYGPGYN